MGQNNCRLSRKPTENLFQQAIKKHFHDKKAGQKAQTHLNFTKLIPHQQLQA